MAPDPNDPQQGEERAAQQGGGEKVVRAADFAELAQRESGASPSMDDLLGVKFEVEAVLGRVQLPISEILRLGSGAVVELDRSISEPVDLMVQGIRVARGEVVVVDDSFGIRIREIAQPRQRPGQDSR